MIVMDKKGSIGLWVFKAKTYQLDGYWKTER